MSEPIYSYSGWVKMAPIVPPLGDLHQSAKPEEALGVPVAWTWEYFAGQYIIRREDMTKQVAIEAPCSKRNNVAADGLCQWLDDLEYAPAVPAPAKPGDKSRQALEAAIAQNVVLMREVQDLRDANSAMGPILDYGKEWRARARYAGMLVHRLIAYARQTRYFTEGYTWHESLDKAFDELPEFVRREIER
jgi:hypothetical protein